MVSNMGREISSFQSSFANSARMWRNDVRVGNNAQENHDSDQSISEEEEVLDSEWTGKTISLSRGENNMNLICQLKKGGYHIEDEVEIPMFSDGDSPSHHHRGAAAAHPHTSDGMIYLPAVAPNLYSDEDIISDDEKFSPPALGSAIKNLGGTWSQAGREVEALARSNEKASCSSHHDVFLSEKKSSRGGGGRKKAKPRFSFPVHSHKKEISLAVSDSNGRTSSSENITVANEIDAAADDDMDNDMAESQLNFHDKETEQPGNYIVPFEMAHNHDTRGPSMAEVLNCFLERSDQKGRPEVEIHKYRRRVHKISERSSSPLDDVILDDDDLPEASDSDTPFQIEDDENAQRLKSSIPGTMVDQFHEAFGTASLNEDMLQVAFPRPLCSGLYLKLQQVMQSEKEKDMHFPRNASVETSFKAEGMKILVRILSRSLEGKLIVCSGTSVGNGKNSYWENNLEPRMNGIDRTLTIIFNPRMCSDVDLEVGNLICVHPPWKEVQVKDEVIYLCSHFVQVQP